MNDKRAFRPINDDHAIQSVKFALGFTNLIAPDAVQRVAGAHTQWAESLPAFVINESVIEGGIRRITVPVATFAFLRPNGAANWSMDVGGNQVSVECFLYTRWNRVWEAAGKYIKQATAVLGEAQKALQIASIELTVRDVFVSSDQNYRLFDLFDEESGYVSRRIFNINGAWHCNSGWFEPLSDSAAALNHLNTDATPTEDQRAWQIGITHLQQERFLSPIPIASLVANASSIVDDSMSRMHNQNKSLLCRLLKSEMTNKIGLVGGAK